MIVKDLKVGCQTFTWEMLGDRFDRRPRRPAQGDRRWRLCRHRDHRHDDRPLCRQAGGVRRRAEDIRPDAGLLRLRLEERLHAARRRSAPTSRPPGAGSISPPPFRARWCRWARRRSCPTGRATTSSPLRPRSTTRPANSAARPASRSRCIRARTTTRCCSTAPTTTASSACSTPSLVGWVPDTGHILRGHKDMADTLTHLSRPHPLRAPEGRRCATAPGRCSARASATRRR